MIIKIINLTFLLSPGCVLETEDRRKNLGCKRRWSRSAFMLSIFSNLMKYVFFKQYTWLGPRAVPYIFGWRSATRRRKWVKCLWFDDEKKKRGIIVVFWLGKFFKLYFCICKWNKSTSVQLKVWGKQGDEPLTEITDFGIIKQGCTLLCYETRVKQI